MASSSLWKLSSTVRQNKNMLFSYSKQPWQCDQVLSTMTAATRKTILRPNSSLTRKSGTTKIQLSLIKNENRFGRYCCGNDPVLKRGIVNSCHSNSGMNGNRNSCHSTTRFRLVMNEQPFQVRQNQKLLLQRQVQNQQVPKQQPKHFYHATNPIKNSTTNSTNGKPSSPTATTTSTSTSGTPTTTTTTTTTATTTSSPGATKSFAGTGRPAASGDMNEAGSSMEVAGRYAENKTPVSWSMLFFVGISAASAVAYYRIERERRLERAMGKVVSSELTTSGSSASSSGDNDKEMGWSPSPSFAKRVYVPTKYGWFPKDDGWTAGKFLFLLSLSFH